MHRLWGVNLAAAEKEVWRRHRRIMGPAFNNKMYVFSSDQSWARLSKLGTRYNMVWQKTLATYHDCVAAEGWDQVNTIDAPRVQQYTFKVCLLFSLGLLCQITHRI